jgi:hypothetical protein
MGAATSVGRNHQIAEEIMAFSVLESVVGAVAGQEAGPCEFDSGVLDDDTATGVLLTQGATDDSFKLPTTAAEIVAAQGVSVYDPFKTPHDETNGIQDADGDEIAIVKKGWIWARTEETIALGDKVYSRFLANSTGKLQLGAFRNDADPASAVVTVSNTNIHENDTFTVTISDTLTGDQLATATATADASPTPAEVVTALVAALVLYEHLGFDVADGGASSSDRLLTVTPRASRSGLTVAVSTVGGVITVDGAASSTAAHNHCAEVVNARWRGVCTGASICKLEVSFP